MEMGDVPDGELLVRFGRVSFRTQLGNVERWGIEGPFRWVTAIGLRRSIRHGDLSLAGSPHGGLRMDFRTPVRWFIFRVPARDQGPDREEHVERREQDQIPARKPRRREGREEDRHGESDRHARHEDRPQLVPRGGEVEDRQGI